MSGISLTSPDTHQPSCGTELRTLKTHQEPFKPPQEPPHGPLEPDQEQLEHPKNPQILQMNPVQFSTDHETSDPRNFLSTPQEVLKPPQEPPTLLKQPREPLKPYAEIKSTPVTTFTSSQQDPSEPCQNRWKIMNSHDLTKTFTTSSRTKIWSRTSGTLLRTSLIMLKGIEGNYKTFGPHQNICNTLKNCLKLLGDIRNTFKNPLNLLKHPMKNLWNPLVTFETCLWMSGPVQYVKRRWKSLLRINKFCTRTL